MSKSVVEDAAVGDHMTKVKILEPGEILAEIEAQPPFKREAAKAAYLGQLVEWSLILADAPHVTSGQVRILLRRRMNDLQYVAANVSPANHPWLAGLPAGGAVRLRGRIAAIDGRSVELEADDVTYLAKQPGAPK